MSAEIRKLYSFLKRDLETSEARLANRLDSINQALEIQTQRINNLATLNENWAKPITHLQEEYPAIINDLNDHESRIAKLEVRTFKSKKAA